MGTDVDDIAPLGNVINVANTATSSGNANSIAKQSNRAPTSVQKPPPARPQLRQPVARNSKDDRMIASLTLSTNLTRQVIGKLDCLIDNTSTLSMTVNKLSNTICDTFTHSCNVIVNKMDESVRMLRTNATVTSSMQALQEHSALLAKYVQYCIATQFTDKESGINLYIRTSEDELKQHRFLRQGASIIVGDDKID